MNGTTRRVIAGAFAAALIASAVAPAATAAVPADRVLPTTASVGPVFLTEKEVKAAAGVTTPLVPLPARTVTITSSGVAAEQKYSSLGAVFDAYAKTYKGPFQYVSAKVVVGPTDAGTAAEWKKLKDLAPISSNRLLTNTNTKIVAYKGSSVADTSKRVAFAWVIKDGLIAGGECATFTKKTTEKQLTTCADRVATAQWAKANKAIKVK